MECNWRTFQSDIPVVPNTKLSYDPQK